MFKILLTFLIENNDMAQPLRIENPNNSYFFTSRTVNSLLWFVNNNELSNRILGYLAKYQQKYSVTIYSFVIVGNHYHLVAKFPNKNKSLFFRDFNARFAEATRAIVKGYLGGHLFARRFSEQALPLKEDVEDRFFYSALQAVSAGLVEDIKEYNGYNSFFDAIEGIERKYKVIDYSGYRKELQYNKKVNLKDFSTEYSLKFTKLEKYEKTTQDEYRKFLLDKLKLLQKEIIRERTKNGLSFLGKNKLKQIKPGSLPYKTKKSKLTSYRPLVLTKCLEAKNLFLSWYFSIWEKYKSASKVYRKGFLDVIFPSDTYKPPLLSIC